MSVRAMLARVQRIEQARCFRSPFTAAFGSFEAFEAWSEVEMGEGRMDRADFPVVLHCLARWERDGTWGAAAHG
jgi:hypothetical protein